jgi:hypothetical protein
VFNLKERSKDQLEITGQQGKRINALHFSKPPKEGPSTGTKAMLSKASDQKPMLAEVQNTQQPQPKPPVTPSIKAPQKVSLAKQATPEKRPQSRASEQEVSNKVKNDKFLDERAIKAMASQGIDETKRKLEKDIQMMHEQIRAMAPPKVKDSVPQSVINLKTEERKEPRLAMPPIRESMADETMHEDHET